MVADRSRQGPPGRAAVLFCIWYGAGRFATDTLRAYDDRVAGLTGAQWMSAALVLAGLAVHARLRSQRSASGAT